MGDEGLAREHGLTAEEYARVCELLGRAPNITELGMFSVMWSEHCSYKSSRVHLRTLPTGGPRVLQGPGENAGAVDVGGGYAAVFKVESHNHPSYIEPYEGAATGVGGILRDIFTMGARPLALLNSLRFGSLEAPRNRYLLERVVAGIASYGNCVGVPTVGGEIYFDPAYDHNPLVNVLCLGVARSDRLVRAQASGPGSPVVYVGAKTGRDGIYGVSLLASAAFGAGAAEKRPAVQVGDPFTEKLLMESCLELVERGLVVGMQDMGGAGLTCATCEMSARAGTGMVVDVGRVPARESGMTPYELMLSESQERMLLVCRREDLETVVGVFERWGLHAVEVGEVTDDGVVRVLEGHGVVAEVPARALADGAPLYRRPMRQPACPPELGAGDLAPPDELLGGGYLEALLRLLADPTIASKGWVFRQYDQTVRTNTVRRPGEGAAVIRVKETGAALALSLDGNPWFTALDPRRGAALAVAEACRNVACSGAVPVGITNCLNFGSPETPEVMGQFAAAVQGLGEACRALGVPVTGGNVSFYNETAGRPILPTPVVGALGLLEDAAASVAAAFQAEGDAILLLGARTDAPAGDAAGPLDWGLGGSALVRCLHGGRPGAPPAIDLGREAALHRLLAEAASRGWLRSAHDCSDGGLGVALAEACFGGADGGPVEAWPTAEAAVPGLLGAVVDLGDPAAGRADLRLFGESAGRVLVSVAPGRVADVLALAREHGVPAARLGTVGGIGACLEVRVGGERLLRAPVARLYLAWAGSLPRRVGMRR